MGVSRAAVDAAKATYTIESDVLDSRELINDLWLDLSLNHEEKDGVEHNVWEISTQYLFIRWAITDAAIAFDRVKRGLKQISGLAHELKEATNEQAATDEKLKKLEELQKDSDATRDFLIRRRRAKNSEAYLHKRSTEDFDAEVFDMVSKSSNVATEAYRLLGEVNQTSTNYLAHAQTLSDELEHKYDRYTRASYVLYTLGWALALAGRLFGIEGLVTGGD